MLRMLRVQKSRTRSEVEMYTTERFAFSNMSMTTRSSGVSAARGVTERALAAAGTRNAASRAKRHRVPAERGREWLPDIGLLRWTTEGWDSSRNSLQTNPFVSNSGNLPPRCRPVVHATRLFRNAAALAFCAALAGCVGVPEELLGSTAIVAGLPREAGALVEAARFSEGRAGGAPPGDWGRFIVSPFATRSEYRLVESGSGVVLEGRADGSASGYYRRVRFDPARYPVVEWRWRVMQPPKHTDPRVPSRDDSAARVIVAFHGDVTRLDIGERFALSLYNALTGEKMPYAIIMYTSSGDAPVGTIVANDR